MLYSLAQKEHTHSKYLLHIQRGECKWVDLYRLVRLANSVKKQLIVVITKDEEILKSLIMK